MTEVKKSAQDPAAVEGSKAAAVIFKKDAKEGLEGQGRSMGGRSVSLYAGLGVFFGILACGMFAGAALCAVLGYPWVLPTAFALCTALGLFTSLRYMFRAGKFSAYRDVYDLAEDVADDGLANGSAKPAGKRR